MDNRSTVYAIVPCKGCNGEGGYAGLKSGDAAKGVRIRREWVACPECDGLGEVIPGHDPEGECVCGMNNGEHSRYCDGDDWLDNEPDYYVD